MTDSQILLLLAVRLRSRATAEVVGATFGQLGGDATAFRPLLAEAERHGQVRSRGEEQRRSLTEAGEVELAANLAAETERVGRADLGTAYEAFLPLNRRFLTTLAGDPQVAELDELVAALVPILEAFAARLARFSGYGVRFAAALARAASDPEWIAGPRVDSVHTIWFELHEHLLATLGRNRTEER